MIPRAPLQAILAFATLILSLAFPGFTAAADTGRPQYYELRIYSTKSEAQQKLINDYWQKAAVPANW